MPEITAVNTIGGSMRPLYRGGRRCLIRRHDGAMVRPGDPVVYTDGGKLFLHRVWVTRGKLLIVGDDAAVCSPHRVHRSRVVGSAVSGPAGLPGLVFGLSSHLAFGVSRLCRAFVGAFTAWLPAIILILFATATASAVAPDPIANLSALAGPAEAGTLTLAWTAPQEGAGNTVSAYDIRGATKTFGDADWDAPWVRTLYAEPTPLAPGTPQSLTLTNLAQGTTYYFRIKSSDGAGTVSPISSDPPAWAPSRRTTTETFDLATGTGVVRWGYSSATGDITTPLAGTQFTGTQYANISATDTARADTAGTANNTVVAQRYLFKISPSTATITLLRPRWTGWDEGAIGTGRIPTFYIWNYNSSAWSTIQTGAAQLTDQTLSGSYTSNMNYYVNNSSCNLKVICPAAGNGKKSYIHSNYASLAIDYTVATDSAAPAAVTGLSADTGVNPNEVTLSWNAPGDDGAAHNNSMMAYYIVKYATYAVTADTSAWWNGAYGAIQTYTQNWPVAPLSTAETKTLSMPTANARYWFALRTVDETGRLSGITINGPAGSSCTVSAVSRPSLTPPLPPSALTQLTTASGGTIPSGSWLNYQQVSASFTLTDPFWRNTLQYNIQLSTWSDFSYAHVSATAPASTTLPQGTTRYTTGLLADGTWYWRVRAINSDGLLSAYSSMTVVNGRHFGVDTTSPAAPALIAPVSGSTTAVAAAFFDWTDVADLSGVRGYTLRVSSASDFSGTVVSSSTTVSSATLSLPEGLWYWAVRSSDTAGNIGDWSSSWTIRIDTAAPAAPTLFTPPYGSTTAATSLVFDWADCDDPGGTGGYLLRISSAPDISGTVISSSTVLSQASMTLGEGVWYWTVRSSDTAGNTGAWAAPWHIRIDTTPPGIPIPAAPLNGSTVTITSINFDWGDVSDTSGISGYVAQFSTTPAFSGDVRVYTSAASQVQADLDVGLWYWTVRSSDTAWNASGWSSVWNVRVDTASAPSIPVLQSPLDADACTQPHISFDWNDSESVHGISVYTLRASTTPDFSSPVHSSYTQVSQADLTLEDGRWFWTVRSSDTLGHFTDWASTRSFIIDGTPPSVPVLSAPLPGTKYPAEHVTFSWEQSADPAGIGRYTVRVATTSDFSGTVISSVTALTSATLALYENTWYWTTRASDTYGNTSMWADPWVIHVDTTLPSQPAMVAPADGSTTTVATVSLSWEASSDASGVSGYTVRAATSANFSGPVVSSWTALTTATVPMNEQRWYWAVRSSDTAGNANAWTSAWSLRVDTTPPTAINQLAPADGTISPSPDIVYDWTDAADTIGIAAYTVRFATTADFSGAVFSTETAVSQASLTRMEGSWYWSVRAVDHAGNANDWAAPWTAVVDTTPPSVPSLASPVNGSTSTVPAVAFLWSPSLDTNGISVYTVRASTYADFSQAVMSSCTAQTSALITLTEGVWYWTVRSSDTAGNFSAWASTRTGIVVTPPTTVTDLAASRNASTAGMINLSWSAPADHQNNAVGAYDVRLGTASFNGDQWDEDWLFHAINEPSPGIPGISESMTVAGLVPGATYYFRIRSSDDHAIESAVSADPIATACAGTTSAEVYDLSVGTGITRWAYQSLLGDITTDTGGTQVSSPQYAGLALLDSLMADTTGSSNKRIVAQRYQFKIARATNTITALTPSWTGWVEQGPGTGIAPTLYIWNYNNAAWQLVASGAAQRTDQTFSTVTFTTNMNYFVRNSSCNLKMVCPAASSNVRSYIHSNYVRLTIDYTVAIDSVPPAAITDLAARTGNTPNEVILNWTAPGDNGAAGDNGSYASYTVYYATFAVASNTGTWLAGGYGPVATYPQAWSVGPRGAPEQFTLMMPEPARRYWLAVRTTDEGNNRSPININGPTGSSTTVNALSQEGMRIAINEIYAAGSDGADWVELYNTTEATYTLTACELKYNLGSIALPGAETTAWSAVEGGTLPPRGYLVLPGLSLDSASSQHVILKDAVGNTVDTLQWPAGAPSGASFSRIIDGATGYFELDPTPTAGCANTVSTGAVRINEIIPGPAEQVVEFFNSVDEPLSQAPVYLRNSQMMLFRSTRTIPALAYAGLDSGSGANNGLTWADCFGTGGLSPAADVLVLENEAGQTVDRITWGSGAPPYFDYEGVSLPYTRAAPGNITAPHSLIRRFDGVDTGNNALDVVISTETSIGMSNRYPAGGASTILTYPDTQGIVLPRRCKFAVQLGGSIAAGRTNTAWFMRTGGAPDPHSPHVYQLTDWGIQPAILTPQTTAQTLTEVLDIDGHTLVNGTVYTLLVNCDNGADASPQAARTGLTCDDTIHSARLEPILLPVAGNAAQVGLFKFTVVNESSRAGNTIQLSTVSVRLTDGGDGALNIADIFTDIYVCGDNPDAGTRGAYQPAIDTATLAHVSGAGLQLVNGTLTIPIDPYAAPAVTVAPQQSEVFFLSARLAPAAAGANGYKAGMTPALSVVWHHASSGVRQPGSSGVGDDIELLTSSQTVITPQPPASGTTFPAVVTAPGSQISAAAVNSAGTVAYCASANGSVHALDSTGMPKWEVTIGGPVTALYDASYEENENFVYAVSSTGVLGKIKHVGDSGHVEWTRDLGYPISSDIAAPGGNALYVATTEPRLFKMSRDGIDADGMEWDQTPAVTGGLCGTPVIDSYSQGVNALWYPSTDGTFYRLNTLDGSVSVPVTVSPGGINTSPCLLAGFASATKNTHFIYFGDNDGYFRARNASNLTDKPADWPAGDVYVSSAIRSSPYFDGSQFFYFGADNGILYKVDARTGASVALFQARGPIRCMPVVGDNNDVYFGADDGCFYGVSTANGALLAGFPIVTGGEIRSLCWASDPTPRIYFFSNDGKAYCIEVP